MNIDILQSLSFTLAGWIHELYLTLCKRFEESNDECTTPRRQNSGACMNPDSSSRPSHCFPSMLFQIANIQYGNSEQERTYCIEDLVGGFRGKCMAAVKNSKPGAAT